MVEGSDNNNKLNLVVSVFGREFSVLFSVYSLLYLSDISVLISAVLVKFLIIPLPHLPALGFKIGRDLREEFLSFYRNWNPGLISVCSMRLSRHQAAYVKSLPAFSRALVFKLEHV